MCAHVYVAARAHMWVHPCELLYCLIFTISGKKHYASEGHHTYCILINYKE